MNRQKLDTAIDEAIRFLRRAEEFKLVGTEWGCKESGAVRRSSMDLTRSLADLRRYGE